MADDRHGRRPPDVQRRRRGAALPQYIAKHCTKADQAPIHAPKKLRSLRATRGFLKAPTPRAGKYTGELQTRSHAKQREGLDRQIARVRDVFGWKPSIDENAVPFEREVERLHGEMLSALATGDAVAPDFEITGDPETWPPEWTSPADASDPRSASSA